MYSRYSTRPGFTESLKDVIVGQEVENASKQAKIDALQKAEKKRRAIFLIFNIISGCGALIALHLLAPGTPPFTLQACLCGLLVLLFVISGFGLLLNLFRKIEEDEEQQTHEG